MDLRIPFAVLLAAVLEILEALWKSLRDLFAPLRGVGAFLLDRLRFPFKKD